MIIDFEGLSGNRIYHTMTQTLIPRPVAWVLSDNGGNQSYNLAPFSYFTAVSSEPALLMISIGKKADGSLKDTRKNILENKRCVIHIASADLVDTVTDTAATLEHGESEIDKAGLKTQCFDGFELPRLSCCDIAFACELYEYKEIGEVQQGLIFLAVKQVYINDDVISNTASGRLAVDTEKVNPLARLGGSEYWVDGRSVKVQRPT